MKPFLTHIWHKYPMVILTLFLGLLWIAIMVATYWLAVGR